MKFNIIYADPPWDFSNRMYSSNKNDHHREISRAYSVMKTKNICNLRVSEIAEQDAALFMWTTDAHIPDAIKVMKAWGFKYKTVVFIWLKKERSGKQVCYMGQWTMKNAELCLLGIRGKMQQHLKSRKVRQLVEAARDRSKHSKKPEEVRHRIEIMFGNMPRIELFARYKVDGWESWGDEVESDIDLGLSSPSGVQQRIEWLVR